MLLISERSVPAMAQSWPDCTPSWTLPLSMLMSMPVGRGPFRLPLGPLTWICCSLTDSSTPLGRVIGFFATRDMSIVSLCHDGEDFAAQALLARMRIGHHAPGRGDDA